MAKMSVYKPRHLCMQINPCLDLLFHARFYDPVGKKLFPVMAENAQALRYRRVKKIVRPCGLTIGISSTSSSDQQES